MAIQYICSLLTVQNIEKSKNFYQYILNQEIEMDHGENIAFKGGFAIHDRKHFQQLIEKEVNTKETGCHVELYFESDDLTNLQEKLESINTHFLHPLKEQPWGQRVMRFYDPDNYIIEIGESMEDVILRYFQQGMTAKEVSERTSMPLEIVEMIINSI